MDIILTFIRILYKKTFRHTSGIISYKEGEIFVTFTEKNV